MKVNVTHAHDLHQEEFENIGGLSINPEDGELALLDHEAVVLHIFGPGEWQAFAVEREE